MKFALILPSNIWFSPYLKIYTKIFDDLNVEYDLISWNRDGTDDKSQGIQYDAIVPYGCSLWRVLKYYYLYSRFIKRNIEKRKYDRLIIFGSQLAIFLSSYLCKKYKNNYIIDYRDLSIEQKIYLSPLFKKVLKNSALIFISSPGFKKYLPLGFNYKLSHNFDVNLVKAAISNKFSSITNEKFDILTIGGIRDYESNVEVIKSLANRKKFSLYFVGKGIAASKLEYYAKQIGATNVKFVGYYKKEEEGTFILNSSMLNIFYPKIKSHSSALSNRFYNALIYRKPMIVTSNSIQGDYVEKYNLGLAVDNCMDLDRKIVSYFDNFNVDVFNNNCRLLLNNFLHDYDTFYIALKEFIVKI